MDPEDSMFAEVLAAIDHNQRARARDLLTRLIKANPGQSDYWVWMSAVVDTPKEQIYCLKEALRVDPQNKTAQRGLAILGVLPPDEKWIIPLLIKRLRLQQHLHVSEHRIQSPQPLQCQQRHCPG